MRYNLAMVRFVRFTGDKAERHVALSYAPAGCHDLELQPCNASYWILPGTHREEERW